MATPSEHGSSGSPNLVQMDDVLNRAASLAHSHQRRQSELGNRVLDEIIGQPGFGTLFSVNRRMRAFLSEKLTGQSVLLSQINN